jgi:hypothetical protein
VFNQEYDKVSGPGFPSGLVHGIPVQVTSTDCIEGRTCCWDWYNLTLAGEPRLRGMGISMVGITGKAGVGLGFLTSWMLGLGCDL